MSRERDPLAPSPHWRVDLRLIAELPEDNLIGTRFITHAVFNALAVTSLILAGLMGYRNFSLRYQIRDWEQRIKENASEVREIRAMQQKYAMEAAKIDQAWTLVRPQLRVYDFLTDLGRTRPAQLLIDAVEWSESGITVRCNLRDSPEAPKILNDYSRNLKRDERISPRFDVRTSDLTRGNSDGVLKLEITFRFKPTKP